MQWLTVIAIELFSIVLVALLGQIKIQKVSGNITAYRCTTWL